MLYETDADWRAAIEGTLSAILAARRADVVADAPPLGQVVDLLTPLAMGGKHVRPAFAWWAYVAIAGEPADPAPLLGLAASLDLTHAGLLAHDDLIDASDTRRGMATTHKAVAALGPAGDDVLGVAGAVIGGAWLLQWAQQAFDECGLTITPGMRAAFNAMRSRVLTGQMADAWAGSGLPLPNAVALIDDLKTASYTVVGPVQLGALAAGCDDERLLAFALPVGRAYQARDDVLGVFGRPELTGKPAGDDLRRAKVTALVQAALEMAGPADATRLRATLGNHDASDDQIAEATGIIQDCGALAEVEAGIENDLRRALIALDQAGVTQQGGLARLARACLLRDR